ncbi:hypothetical protein P9112_003027 [Eukaryota sp. TZLM1-RC]
MRDTSLTLRQVDQALSLLSDLEEEFEVSSDDVHHKASVEFLKETIIFLSQEVTGSIDTISELQSEITTQQSVITSLNDFLGTGFMENTLHSAEITTTNPTFAAKSIADKLKEARSELKKSHEFNRKLAEKEKEISEQLSAAHSQILSLQESLDEKSGELLDLKTRNDELSRKLIKLPILGSLSEESRSLISSLSDGQNMGQKSKEVNGLKGDLWKLSQLCERQEKEISLLKSSINHSNDSVSLLDQVLSKDAELAKANQSINILNRDCVLLKNSLSQATNRLAESQRLFRFLESGVSTAISLVKESQVIPDFSSLFDPTTSSSFRIRTVVDHLVSIIKGGDRRHQSELSRLSNSLKKVKVYYAKKAKEEVEQKANEIMTRNDTSSSQKDDVIASLRAKMLNYSGLVAERDRKISHLHEKIKSMDREKEKENSNVINLSSTETAVVASQRGSSRVSESRVRLVESLRLKNKHLQQYLENTRNKLKEKEKENEEMRIRLRIGELVDVETNTEKEGSLPGSIGMIDSSLVKHLFDLLEVPFTNSIFLHHSVEDLLTFIIDRVQVIIQRNTLENTSNDFALHLSSRLKEMEELFNECVDLLSCSSVEDDPNAIIVDTLSQLFNIFESIISNSYHENTEYIPLLKAKLAVVRVNEQALRHRLLLLQDV